MFTRLPFQIIKLLAMQAAFSDTDIKETDILLLSKEQVELFKKEMELHEDGAKNMMLMRSWVKNN